VPGQANFKEVVLEEARMEKDKPKDIPKFIYYRLIRGIKNMFRQMPLFGNLLMKDRDDMLEYIWIEEAA
jgi:hypothetical protein